MFEGKKVAFIATGGFSRGISHIGVLKACEEANIKFDFLIGASAGSIMVTYYSQFKDLDKITDNFRPKKYRKYKFEQFGWNKMLSVKNFFSPYMKSGLLSLDGGEQFFKKALKTNSFEELSTPIYISATNLNKNIGVLFGTGISPDVPISKAITASCCAPLLFRPVKINGEYYIDGEIKRPLSIQSAIDLGADVIIVSDMYSRLPTDYGRVSVFEMGSRIVDMLFEDKSYRGIQVCQARNPDIQIILISPMASSITSLRTSEYRKLIDIGYTTASKVLWRYTEDNDV